MVETKPAKSHAPSDAAAGASPLQLTEPIAELHLCAFGDGPLMLTVADVTRQYRLGRTNLYELLQPGSIAGFKIGRRTFIPRVALEAWLLTQPRYPQARDAGIASLAHCLESLPAAFGKKRLSAARRSSVQKS